MTGTVLRLVGLLVLCIVATVACSQKAAPSLSSADRQQLAQFIKPKLVELGDPTIRRMTVVLGPTTASATPPPYQLASNQAMLVVQGHFTCNHCADDPTQNTTGGTVIYIVSLPGATQSAFQIGHGAHLHGAPNSTFTVTL
jgi:hypothetical protein